MRPIVYEPGTYRWRGMDCKLVKGGVPAVQITHRVVGSQWWDVAPSIGDHTQAIWDTIKREGVRL